MNPIYLIGGGVAFVGVLYGLSKIFGSSSDDGSDDEAQGGPLLDTSIGTPPPWWTPEDYQAHVAASQRLGLNPANWLAIYRSESGLNPAAAFPQKDKNGVPLAVGIGQLTSAADGAAGISEATRATIPSMSVAEQLPIFERYMGSVLQGATPDTAGGIYAFNFLPGPAKANGTAPDSVLGTVAEYPLDKGLDVNGDGVYTVSDLSQHLSAYATDPLYLGALQAMRDAVGDQTLNPVW